MKHIVDFRRIAVLLALLSILGSFPAQAKSTLPPGVQQAMMLFALQVKNRHINLLLKTVGTEHREVRSLVGNMQLAKRLGVERAKTFNRGRSFLLLVEGRFHTISKARANKLLGQFIDYFRKHPKFETLFDRYVAQLHGAERLAINILLIAKSKPSVFRNDARQFMMDTFQTMSNDNLKRSGT